MPGGGNHSSHQLAPYETRRVPTKCALVVDRHVHKNGGSTMRDWFLEHERQGDALYLGYKHTRWTELYSALRQAARSASRASTRVLLIESHYGRVELAEPVLPSLRELSLLYSSRGITCPLVLITRVREPLEYYLSFYRWGVGFRQRDNPGAYGATFLEWVERVPNLQSTMMVQSMASYHAEYLPKRYRANYEANAIIGRTPKAAWRRLRALLDEFAIVGTDA